MEELLKLGQSLRHRRNRQSRTWGNWLKLLVIETNISERISVSGVVLYHEDSLSYKQKHAIYEVCGFQNMERQFYGPEYFMDQIVGWRRSKEI